MKMISRNIKRLNERRGAVLPLVAILMFVLLGFAAFAVDLGYLHVVKGELQNAADSGALAGAAALFDSHGDLQRSQAVSTAQSATVLNKSGGDPVPAPAVEVGHYQFPASGASLGVFTPSSNTEQLQGWQTMSFSSLNTNTDFINAVRVAVSRNNVPTFFSRIFGYSNLATSVQAVAYVGFAGSLPPATVNEPIAICQQCIDSDICNVGRMINSSGGNSSSNTGGWTNFQQPEDCTGAANDPSVNDVVCSSGNPTTILLGKDMQTDGGQMNNVFGNSGNNGLYGCWLQNCGAANSNNNDPQNCTTPWPLTLPVIDCPGVCEGPGNVPNCAKAVGAVDVNVIWVTPNKSDPQFNNAPQPNQQIADWQCPSICSTETLVPQGECCWSGLSNPPDPDFDGLVQHFHLQNYDNTPATYQKATIYFLPSCTRHEPIGVTGGANFGILARYPVLVK